MRIFLTTLLFIPTFLVGLTTNTKAAVAPPQPSYTVQENLKCNSDTGINTAIGCIPFNDETALMRFLLRWFIGISGGIGLIMIIYAAILIITASGNPDKVKAGQELMTAAIGGVVFLIFSVFILRIIGVDIFGLPSFGR
jgi:hypothetical protein